MDRNLRAFLAVAKLGNLTAAAESIGLTQPALTKTVRRLEDMLGARLFERSAKGMVLTEVGGAFLERALTIEMNWTQAREEVRARTKGTLSEFHVAAGAAYNTWIAPQLLRRLTDEFPDTRLVLESDVSGVMLPKLQAGEIHLLLGAFIQEVPDGIITEKLMDVVNGVLCCKTHPLAQLSIVPAEALQEYRWVIYKRDTLMHRRLANYFMQFQLPPPRVMMEIDTMASTMRMVSETSYLTATPTSLGTAAAEFGLVQLPLTTPIWAFPSGLWMRRSTSNYPILQRSVEILRELVRDNPNHSPMLSASLD